MHTKQPHKTMLPTPTPPPPYAPDSLIDIDTHPSTWGTEHLLPKKVKLSILNATEREPKLQKLKDHRKTKAYICDILGDEYDKVNTKAMSREERWDLLRKLRKAALTELLYMGEGPFQVTHPEQFDAEAENKWLMSLHKKFLDAAPVWGGCEGSCEDDEDDEEVLPMGGKPQDAVESDSESEDDEDGDADAEQEGKPEGGANERDRVKVKIESKGEERLAGRKRDWGVECKACTAGFGMMADEEGDAIVEQELEKELEREAIVKRVKMEYKSRDREAGLTGRNRDWGVECKACTRDFGMIATEDGIEMGGFH